MPDLRSKRRRRDAGAGEFSRLPASPGPPLSFRASSTPSLQQARHVPRQRTGGRGAIQLLPAPRSRGDGTGSPSRSPSLRPRPERCISADRRSPRHLPDAGASSDGHFRSTLPPSLGREGRGQLGGGAVTLRQACPRDNPRAQLAFKNSMIRGILQFTLGIAFRCVLHRCKSQDIRC